MITKLRVQNFRKHKDFTANLTDRSTIITGSNGSGKTSLLEAAYVALQGKSWRSNFAEIARDDNGCVAGWWRVDIEFNDSEKRVVKYKDGIKTFEIAQRTFTRLPTKFKWPVILFEPGDLQLLYGSPARRRDFFDRFITQINPTHATNLRKFERVLRQRNSLLKRGATRNELFVWDLQFADLAEKIIATRDEWIAKINEGLDGQYQKIAETQDKVTVTNTSAHKTRTQILRQLELEWRENWPFTRSGPQTQDVKFKFNNHDAKLTASRGETRTILFATLAQMTKLLHAKFGSVYVLLDDIDSELDDVRRRNLQKQKLFTDDQLLITTIRSSRRHGVIQLNES